MKVLMLGTEARGGMRSVAEAYVHSLKNYDVVFLPTHIEHDLVVKSIYFFVAFLKTIPFLFNKECIIFHMHVSVHGSIIRKGILARIARLFRKKVVFHMHGADFFPKFQEYDPKAKERVRKTFSLADKIIVLSELRKKEYKGICDPGKLVVIPNFVQVPGKLKPKPGKASQELTLISLGRLGERKGTADLLEAVEKLKNKRFFVELAGDGDIKKYEKMATGLGIKDRVKFHGWISGKDKEGVLSRGDIFVLPSYHEDLPVSILEAMSYGMPIVSTKVAGIPELVHDNVNGFLIEPGDVDDLASKLGKLISDRRLRESMGKSSRDMVKKGFSEEVVVDKVTALYEGLAG
ncbi:glycosyltransferase family 4 protein [Candidatus Woesearchaeota archaeon]|nr:glycosyltransferase family 4 protein [Candidatus Woesearchaeota archaeon]